MIRAILLSKYGGIWIDATTIFYEPMHLFWDALDEYDAQNGSIRSFGFKGPNWFFVARPNVTFFNVWADQTRSTFQDYRERAKQRGDMHLAAVSEHGFWDKEYYVFSFHKDINRSSYDCYSRSIDDAKKYDVPKLKKELGLGAESKCGISTYTVGSASVPIFVKIHDSRNIPNTPWHSITYWRLRITDRSLFERL